MKKISVASLFTLAGFLLIVSVSASPGKKLLCRSKFSKSILGEKIGREYGDHSRTSLGNSVEILLFYHILLMLILPNVSFQRDLRQLLRQKISRRRNYLFREANLT